jgi:hypothetical protein
VELGHPERAIVILCDAHESDYSSWDPTTSNTAGTSLPSKEQLLRSRLIRIRPGEFPQSAHRSSYERFSAICKTIVTQGGGRGADAAPRKTRSQSR